MASRNNPDPPRRGADAREPSDRSSLSGLLHSPDVAEVGRARTAPPSRGGANSGRRSVGRSSSERCGDVVLAQPQRRGAQQAAIAAPSRPGSAEQPSVLPTPRCCSRPHPGVRGLGALRLLRLSRLLRPRYAFATPGPAAAGCCLHAERSSAPRGRLAGAPRPLSRSRLPHPE